MDSKKWIKQYAEMIHIIAITDKEERDFLIERDFESEENFKSEKGALEREFWFYFENYLKDNPEVKLNIFFGNCLVKFPLLWKNRELDVLHYIELAAPNTGKLDNAALLLETVEMKQFMKENLGNPKVRKQCVKALCVVADRTFETGWGETNRRYLYKWLPTMLDDFPEISEKVIAVLEKHNQRNTYFVWTAIYTSIKRIYLRNNY